jgi:hypothetical protein
MSVIEWRVFKAKPQCRFSVLLALALAIAQFGAVAHAYSHLHRGQDSTDHSGLHAARCGDCASFGTLLVPGAMVARNQALPFDSTNALVQAGFTSSVSAAVRHYFQAQGPPRLR